MDFDVYTRMFLVAFTNVMIDARVNKKHVQIVLFRMESLLNYRLDLVEFENNPKTNQFLSSYSKRRCVDGACVPYMIYRWELLSAFIQVKFSQVNKQMNVVNKLAMNIKQTWTFLRYIRIADYYIDCLPFFSNQ